VSNTRERIVATDLVAWRNSRKLIMIYGLFFRRYAPFDTFGLFGFEGDSRDKASTSLTVTARTIGALNFAPGNVGNMAGESSGTTLAGWGKPIQRMLGTYHSKVTSSVSVETRSIDCLRFTAQTAGANPMIPFGAAPPIDTFVDVQVVFRPTAIELSGIVRGDNFPNAEIFVTDAQGQSVMLFEYATTGGRNTGPFTRLAGTHADQVLGDFSKRVPIVAGGAFA
jgi:hypothetical protein